MQAMFHLCRCGVVSRECDAQVLGCSSAGLRAPEVLSDSAKTWVDSKRRDLTQLMWSSAGIVRRRADMKAALQQLATLHHDVQVQILLPADSFSAADAYQTARGIWAATSASLTDVLRSSCACRVHERPAAMCLCWGLQKAGYRRYEHTTSSCISANGLPALLRC